MFAAASAALRVAVKPEEVREKKNWSPFLFLKRARL